MGKKSIGGKRPGAGRPKGVKKERFPATPEEREMILALRYKNISKIAVKKENTVKVVKTIEIAPIKKSLKELLNEIK